MEMEPGIHQLTHGREPFAGFPPPNAFLVAGRDASVLIDAGWDWEEDHRERMRYVESAHVPPIVELIITHKHPDHGGGAALFHEATGVPMTCHALDRAAIEAERLKGRAPLAGEVRDGDRRDLGGLTVEVVHAPGHTPGCLAIWVPERGALIATDTVMQISTTVLRPGEGNLRDYVRTLERFQALESKTIYCGHGGPSRVPGERLRQLLLHRQARERDLLKVLEASARTVGELRAAIYKELPEVRWKLAEDQLLTGIEKLIDDGAVRREEGERFALAK